eukprot:TRINITY_DN61182_c0_g1_i1.p1 TRINITY_DN61182_c0_g1~~TRINITY_DN61182_c0_g1_i1.p1  ORF type:complete len:776 (-),score=166.50 TRINITY_DN61182_c0_g1_i1:191-2518(-)
MSRKLWTRKASGITASIDETLNSAIHLNCELTAKLNSELNATETESTFCERFSGNLAADDVCSMFEAMQSRLSRVEQSVSRSFDGRKTAPQENTGGQSEALVTDRIEVLRQECQLKWMEQSLSIQQGANALRKEVSEAFRIERDGRKQEALEMRSSLDELCEKLTCGLHSAVGEAEARLTEQIRSDVGQLNGAVAQSRELVAMFPNLNKQGQAASDLKSVASRLDTLEHHVKESDHRLEQRRAEFQDTILQEITVFQTLAEERLHELWEKVSGLSAVGGSAPQEKGVIDEDLRNHASPVVVELEGLRQRCSDISKETRALELRISESLAATSAKLEAFVVKFSEHERSEAQRKHLQELVETSVHSCMVPMKDAMADQIRNEFQRQQRMESTSYSKDCKRVNDLYDEMLSTLQTIDRAEQPSRTTTLIEQALAPVDASVQALAHQMRDLSTTAASAREQLHVEILREMHGIESRVMERLETESTEIAKIKNAQKQETQPVAAIVSRPLSQSTREVQELRERVKSLEKGGIAGGTTLAESSSEARHDEMRALHEKVYELRQRLDNNCSSMQATQAQLQEQITELRSQGAAESGRLSALRSELTRQIMQAGEQVAAEVSAMQEHAANRLSSTGGVQEAIPSEMLQRVLQEIADVRIWTEDQMESQKEAIREGRGDIAQIRRGVEAAWDRAQYALEEAAFAAYQAESRAGSSSGTPRHSMFPPPWAPKPALEPLAHSQTLKRTHLPWLVEKEGTSSSTSATTKDVVLREEYVPLVHMSP